MLAGVGYWKPQHVGILEESKDPIIEVAVANLSCKLKVTKLHIELHKPSYIDVSGRNQDEVVLEGLQPHPNLR